MTTVETRNPVVTIAVLFLVIFIDQMGITFIFPILTPLFMHANTHLFTTAVTPETRDVLYGLCLALYPFFMFFGSPLLGNLSDQVGRKKILLICLIGSAVGFLLSALAINLNSLILLLVSRSFAGFFSGGQYIAQAAVADISPPDKRAINLSYIIVAISVGMIFGPLVGGYFSDAALQPWFTYATPFEAAAILAIINAVLLLFTFSETFIAKTQVFKFKLFEGFILFKQAFADKKIRLLSMVLFALMFGWTLYFQSISWFLFQRYHFNAAKLGLFIGYLGIGFAIALTIVLRLLLKYIKIPTRIVLICLVVDVIAVVIAFIVPHEYAEWLTAPFVVGAMAITYTMLLSLFSNTVDEKQQGLIMGITGALVAIAWTISGLVAGPLGYFHIIMPLVISAVVFAIGWIMSLKFTDTNLHKHEQSA